MRGCTLGRLGRVEGGKGGRFHGREAKVQGKYKGREGKVREEKRKKERFWILDDTGNLSMHVFTTHLTDGFEPVYEVVQLLLLSKQNSMTIVQQHQQLWQQQ